VIRHHPSCTANYPEKPEREEAQGIQEIELDGGETIQQCVDCGAFESVRPPLSPSSLLLAVGTLLYGPHFLTPLSLSLYCPRNPHPGVNYDNLRMWVKGMRPIPSWVWGELERLIQERKEEMRKVEVEVMRLQLCLTSPIDSANE
jgi:hypothetical protein